MEHDNFSYTERTKIFGMMFLLLGVLVLTMPMVSAISCYQESANINNQTGVDGSCGLNYTGNYTCDPTWTGDCPSLGNDGNWNTYMRPNTGTNIYSINYSKPSNMIGGSATWIAKHGYTSITTYSSMLDYCFSEDIIQIYVNSTAQIYGNTDISYYCYNGSAWIMLYRHTQVWTAGNSRFFEEAMNWSGIFINNEVYNISTYETASETYQVNVTANASLTNVNLVYDNINYPATNLGSGIWSKTLDMPLVTSSTVKNFYWNFTHAGAQILSDSNNQTIHPIILTRCNATYAVSYLNYSFKDEIFFTPINTSTVTSTFYYWLGSGANLKSYNYANATEGPYTNFCFSPPNKTINVNYIFQAASSGYATRTFNSITTILVTNVTTNILNYLISSADAGPVTFQITDLTSANVITGARVTITRDILGSNVTIFDGYTDSAGTISAWLSSVVSYTISVSKPGCGSNVQSIVPVGSYNMQLNCAGNITEFVSYIDGVIYQRGPISGIAVTPGNTNFTYYVTSSINPMIGVRFEIYDVDGTLLASNTTLVSSGYSYCTSSACLLTIQYYTANGDNIKGRYYVNVGNASNNTWVLLEKDAYWRYIFINQNNSQQSWKRFTLHFNEFMRVWTDGNQYTNCLLYKTQPECSAVSVCRWLNATEWDPSPPYTKNVNFCILKDEVNKMEFNRILLIFFGLVIGLFIIGRGIGYEMTNPGSFVLVLTVVIGILSAAGMFTFSGLTPWAWFNQYIYVYICATFALGYNLSIIRRYSQ